MQYAMFMMDYKNIIVIDIVSNPCPKQGTGGLLVGRFIGNNLFLHIKKFWKIFELFSQYVNPSPATLYLTVHIS